MKEIQPRSKIDTTVRIPGSKSLTHRAFIAAGLAEGNSRLKDGLVSEDTLYTINALRTLGSQVTFKKEYAEVLGTGGRFLPTKQKNEIFVGNSGTSFRLLISTLALAPGKNILTGTPRMCERPVGGLIKALNQLGVDAICAQQQGYPPVLVHGNGIAGGKVTIPGNQSSQFISSLLLAGPYAEKDLEIEVAGELVSRPYVDLTIHMMEQFGVSIYRDGYRSFKIPCGQGYKPCNLAIEGDVSSASYFWAAAAVTEGTIATANIFPRTTLQGDIAFLKTLEEMGCHVERNTDSAVVRGPALTGIEIDMSAMPDMVPTLASIALFAEGKTVIRNVSHLRLKESDRLQAVALELGRAGGRVKEQDDGIIIYGGNKLTGAVVDPHNDHRLAMSLAIVGLKVPGIKIKQESCVNKSFPNFWELWDNL
jgi:3-phosphoshikimate 1-carboxyvinyltransferase